MTIGGVPNSKGVHNPGIVSNERFSATSKDAVKSVITLMVL